MRKSIAATFPVAFPLLVKTARLKAYGFIAIVFLVGCTATVVRWNSVKMREEIMAYYNDEIMDNLISTEKGLPFVHVDISSVSAAGVSQVSGTVGGGETESFTKTSPSSSMMGVLHTISRAAMTPFAYSASPLHSDTLTMTAVPVIGPLSADSQATESASPALEKSKVTEIRKPPEPGQEEGKLEKTVTQLTPKAQKPETTTIYKLYEGFLCKYPKALVGPKNLVPRPSEADFVEGTLKIWRGRYYYYIEKTYKDKYTDLCQELFTQSRGPATKTAKADLEVLKAQGPTVPSTFRP
jgi:hypothetical protein